MDTTPINQADCAAIMTWRRAKRTELLVARAVLSSEEHRAKSGAVLVRLLSEFAAIRTGRVGIYWSIQHEISLFPLINRILAAGGSIALPVVTEENRPVQFRVWRPGDPLSNGVGDIPFPRDGPTVVPSTLIVALVGFDESNFRLGYGGGYYDRALDDLSPRPWTIGVGFEFMRLETIRPLSHDVPMDAIVTEAGVFPKRAWRPGD